MEEKLIFGGRLKLFLTNLNLFMVLIVFAKN